MVGTKKKALHYVGLLCHAMCFHREFTCRNVYTDHFYPLPAEEKGQTVRHKKKSTSIPRGLNNIWGEF